MIRKALLLTVALLVGSPAFAATGVTIQGPNGKQAGVDSSNNLQVNCATGCAGGGASSGGIGANPFTATSANNGIALAVTSTTGRVALTSGATDWVCNQGLKDAFVTFGSGSVTATTAGIPVKAASCIPLSSGGAADIAGITAGSDTTSLVIIPGSTVTDGAATAANQTTGNTNTAGAVVSTTSPCASAATASCSIAAEIQLLINSTGAGVATPGSAKVASSIQMAGQDGTNAQTLLTDTAGRLKSPCDEATAKSFIVANNTTSVAVSASGVRFCGATGYGVAASTPVWIKLYNIAQGSNTCGANTPVDRVLVATATTGNGAINPAHSVGYGTAMSACVTAGIADADTTAPAASSYVVTIYTAGL